MGSRTYNRLMLNLTVLVRNGNSKKNWNLEKKKKKKNIASYFPNVFHVTLEIHLNKLKI